MIAVHQIILTMALGIFHSGSYVPSI